MGNKIERSKSSKETDKEEDRQRFHMSEETFEEPNIEEITMVPCQEDVESPDETIEQQMETEESYREVEAGTEEETEEEPTEPFSIYIRLQPSVINETTTVLKDKKITLPNGPPKTGLNLKSFLQDEFQIPICLQRLSFQSMELQDTQILRQIHLREDDIITVNYTTTGNLREVQQVLMSMEEMMRALETVADTLSRPVVPQMAIQVLELIIDPVIVEGLLVNYFIPSTSELSKTNRLYFTHNNGIHLTVRIHHLLTNISWEKLTLKMQLLEHSTLRLLWDISSTIGVRCLLFDYPGLVDQVSRSILRVEVIPYKNITSPISVNEIRNVHLTVSHREAILSETMFKGMGVITNLADLPDYRLSIVNIPGLISQMICAMLSPSFTSVCHQIVTSTLLCLSYSISTHPQLTDPLILHGLLQACKKFGQNFSDQPSPVNCIISYFMTVFFAILSTNSNFKSMSDKNDTSISSMSSFMSKFLKNSTYELVHQAEIETCYFSSTIKPLVRLCYFHYEKEINTPTVQMTPVLKELYFTSVKAGIFSIQNISLSDDFKDIVDKEGLIDYLICLPWYVTKDLKDDAQLLVQLTAAKVKLQPPKLMNIAKACLTSSQFTLDEILSPCFIENLYRN